MTILTGPSIPLRKNFDKSLLVQNQGILLAMVSPLFPPLIKGGARGDLKGVAADEILGGGVEIYDPPLEGATSEETSRTELRGHKPGSSIGQPCFLLNVWEGLHGCESGLSTSNPSAVAAASSVASAATKHSTSPPYCCSRWWAASAHAR
jgi:hypothetical protein